MDENLQDFFQSVQCIMLLRHQLGKAKKVQLFRSFLKVGTEVDDWFNSLSATETASMDMIEDAFETRWPLRKVAVKTMAELQAELEAFKLEDKDLGKKVVICGVEEYTHRVHTDNFKRLVGKLHDQSGLLVKSTCKRLP